MCVISLALEFANTVAILSMLRSFRAEHFYLCFDKINKECPQCGLKIERDEGFFLGSLSLNYGVTLICFLTPVMLLAYYEVISSTMAIVLAGIGAMVFPALFYRSSRSWWLMCYYFFLTQHLPANQRPVADNEDENT